MDETTPINREPRVLAGRYALQGLLGSGGMADVQLAHDRVLDRQVAVKILHTRYADDPTFVERFRREAQAAASLNHPNIVAVYDTGDDQGHPFIVMEYVRGRTLREVMRREGLLPQRAIEITSDAARALHYAHERGLVHRDVKPGNIMLSDEGQVKVADFGIARAANTETVTRTAAVFGTAAYIAPEQAQGASVDRRTDVYALGCVLYEMLTGRQPFDAESAVALAYKHVTEQPVAPTRLNPEISPQVEAVVLRAMAKDPAQRYQTARDFAEDLGRAVQGLRVSAAPAAAYASTQALERDRTLVAPPPVEEREVYVDDRRGVNWGAILLAILLLAVFAVAGFLLVNALRQPVPDVTVPDVRNRDIVDAQNVLRSQGFVPELAQAVEDAAVPPNHVIDTDPDPGATVPQGSTVRIIFSRGRPLVQIPPVAGMPEDEAARVLTEAQLAVGERRAEPSDDAPAGTALGTIPEPGTQVQAGSSVVLVVSSGPATVALPSVVNRPEAEAIEELQAACDPRPCVRVQVVREFSDEVPAQRVIRQDPDGGERVPVGSTVTIVVSRGPSAPPPPSPTPTRPPATTPPPEPTETTTPDPSPSPSETQ